MPCFSIKIIINDRSTTNMLRKIDQNYDEKNNTLDLSCYLNTSDIPYLVQFIQNKKVKNLIVDTNKIRNEDTFSLFWGEIAEIKTIQSLQINGNLYGERGEITANAIKTIALTEVNIACRMNTGNLVTIIQSIQENAAIKSLQFNSSNNDIEFVYFNRDGAYPLSEFEQYGGARQLCSLLSENKTKLANLNLEYCNIFKFFTDFTNALSKNNTLVSLRLREGNYSASHTEFKQLADALLKNNSIRSLDLSHYYINDLNECVPDIIALIRKKTPALTNIQLSDGLISDQSMEDIVRVLETNTSLLSFKIEGCSDSIQTRIDQMCDRNKVMKAHFSSANDFFKKMDSKNHSTTSESLSFTKKANKF